MVSACALCDERGESVLRADLASGTATMLSPVATAQMTTTEQRPAVPTAPSWFNVDAVAPRAVRDACKRRTRPLRSCRTKPRLLSPGGRASSLWGETQGRGLGIG